MSHPLYWLAKQFFYPIGNTAATSLTHDLPSEQPADNLLLGCGDPRNILFTIYFDLTIEDVPRQMDITWCDIDPAILARNILMFSLPADNNETIEFIWALFYHFKIDDHTANVIQRQSQKLHGFAENTHSWRQSLYGSFLKMVDTRTLVELRRHWSYYSNYTYLPQEQKERLLKEQIELSRSITSKNSIVMAPSRSAGMVWSKALLPVSQLFQKYWETGTTYTEASDINHATNLNPTFLYYLSGEGFNLQIHLARFSILVPQQSKQQLQAWSAAFRSSRAASTITIRFYCGNTLASCHAPNTFKSTGNSSTGLFAAPYKASQINLDELATSTRPAPLVFDVIDTSNLIDHVGLLNLLITSPPLLKQNPSSQSVLFTEALLPSGEDVTKSFLDRLCTDVPTVAALFGIAPRPYVSGFTSQSHVHEIILFKTMKSELSKLGVDTNVNRYHERVAWINPCGGDTFETKENPTLSFEVESMARILYGIYDKMFSNEKMSTLTSSNTISKLISFTGSLSRTYFRLSKGAFTYVRVPGSRWRASLCKWASNQAVARWKRTIIKTCAFSCILLVYLPLTHFSRGGPPILVSTSLLDRICLMDVGISLLLYA